MKFVIIGLLIIIAVLIVVDQQVRLDASQRIYDIERHRGPDCSTIFFLPAKLEAGQVRLYYRCLTGPAFTTLSPLKR